jgi:hypothetical protein
MIYRTLGLCSVLFVCGCSSANYDPYVAAVSNQLEVRSYQTRQFEDAEYQPLVTAVISTLQDYHFRIVDIESKLGTITAYQITANDRNNRLSGRTELTVLIRQRGSKQYSVRMNMTTGPKVDEESNLYQQFFSALHRKLNTQNRA